MTTRPGRPVRLSMHLPAGILGGLLIAVLAAQPAAAQLSDAQLGYRVVDAVRRCPTFSIFDDVSIGVINRNVTINGWVTDPAKRDDIARRASRVDGIRSITNAIVVLPMTEADVRLRLRVARAIYGNAQFWRYGSSSNPPIHIIVIHGHVTLVGAVSDQTEKALAFALSHVPGAVTVTNGLRVDRD
jgi:osmotically-inducible protein OsmY